jgi:hypothetical protein
MFNSSEGATQQHHSLDSYESSQKSSSIAAQIARLKAFAPITSIICDLQFRLSDSDAREAGDRLMLKVEDESTAVCSAIIGAGDSLLVDTGYIRGQVAPVIADLVANLYRELGDGCFDVNIASALTPSLLSTLDISIPSAWRDSGSRVLVIDSMLNAISKFRSAFDVNSHNFVNKDDACQWAEAVIFSGAKRGVSIIDSEVKSGSGGDPVILFRAMIKQSGSALADAWLAHPGRCVSSESDFDNVLDEIKDSHSNRLDSSIDRICNINDNLEAAPSLAGNL